MRALYNQTNNDIEKAALFIYLNHYCFNGLYRTNLSGSFNVPYGRFKNGDKKIDYDHLYKISSFLNRCQLMNCDFEEISTYAVRGDFVYLDPPYWVNDGKIFSEYQANSFKRDDLQRLRSCLINLDSRNVKFVVSYANCPEGYEILKDWTIKRVTTRRNIAGFAADRKLSAELIATNI